LITLEDRLWDVQKMTPISFQSFSSHHMLNIPLRLLANLFGCLELFVCDEGERYDRMNDKVSQIHKELRILQILLICSKFVQNTKEN